MLEQAFELMGGTESQGGLTMRQLHQAICCSQDFISDAFLSQFEHLLLEEKVRLEQESSGSCPIQSNRPSCESIQSDSSDDSHSMGSQCFREEDASGDGGCCKQQY